MKRSLALLAVCLFSLPVFAGACLVTGDGDWRHVSTEYGLVTLEWQASVSNRCEQPYDGVVRVNFVDTEGTTVHSSMTVVDLLPGSELLLERNERMDQRRFKRVDGLEVVIESERQRPL